MTATMVSLYGGKDAAVAEVAVHVPKLAAADSLQSTVAPRAGQASLAAVSPICGD